MKSQLWHVILVLAIISGSLLPAISSTPAAASLLPGNTADTNSDTLIAQIITIITIITILTYHPLVQSRAAQLLDVTLEGEAIVINFDRQILGGGV